MFACLCITALVIAQAPAPAVSVFSLIPSEPFGLPRVAWIGGAICLAILLLIFSAYF